MKLYSWNVNGIRAVHNKGLFEPFIKDHQPDILCLQETKAQQDQSKVDLPNYNEYWNSAEKKGYSGTAIFTKIKPIAVINDIPDEFVANLKADGYGDANKEGRVIAAEFDDFYVVTAYTPNAKDKLARIDLRQDWDKAMVAYCSALQSGAFRLPRVRAAQLDADSKLSASNGPSRTNKYGDESNADETSDQRQKNQQAVSSADRQVDSVRSSGKPVLYCGDMNVAHTEDDLANPGPNRGKKGFSDQERAGFDAWLKAGFVDTFRMFVQGNGHYTWWTHWANARARNVGWRIDYWLVSKSFKDRVKKAQIHADVMGSDHCPVSIEI